MLGGDMVIAPTTTAGFHDPVRRIGQRTSEPYCSKSAQMLTEDAETGRWPTPSHAAENTEPVFPADWPNRLSLACYTATGKFILNLRERERLCVSLFLGSSSLWQFC
jgi:hypothetical protein